MSTVQALETQMCGRINTEISYYKQRSIVMGELQAKLLVAITGFFRALTPDIRSTLIRRRCRKIVMRKLAYRHYLRTGTWPR